MSTLGYKDTEVFKKSEVATLQLNEAINFFVNENFICSLTLASAAEELFAGLLKSRGQMPAIEESIKEIKKIREEIGVSLMGEKTKSEIIKEWNHAKNRTKHHDINESEIVSFNDCDEAYWMIKRAISNAKYLEILISNEIEFENWIVTKVCL